MVLFLISFILIFLSSYLLAGVFDRQNSSKGLIYIFIFAFSLIVLTFEILSLFSAISKSGVLILNTLMLFVALFIWIKSDKPLWNINIKPFFHKFFNALKLDKILIVLFLSWCFFIFITILMNLLFPVMNEDAMGYHVLRSVFWIFNKNLNHFPIADIRNLVFPINSEIIYSWIIIFLKKDIFIGCVAFAGYLLSIFNVYNILSFMGYSMRKKLWVVFILSSFAGIVIQASNTETDIVIAALITSAIFLFWDSLKNNSKIPLFIASLAYALAVGTKTTAILFIPAVLLIMLYLCKKYKNYRALGYFTVFCFINFLIFSSYNYILNIIDYGNPMGTMGLRFSHKNIYGIKGFISSVIKHIFLFFDFTGFKWSEYLGDYILSFKSAILTFLNVADIPDGVHSIKNPDINNFVAITKSYLGILGFSLFLPTCIWTLFYGIFKKSFKARLSAIFSASFFIGIFVLSAIIAFMTYNVRFLLTLTVISSPILVFTYFKNKNPLKYIIVLFAVFYLVVVSRYILYRPIFALNGETKHSFQKIFTQFHSNAPCLIMPETVKNICMLENLLEKNFSKKNNILFLSTSCEDLLLLKLKEFHGLHFDVNTFNNFDNIDFAKYNLIILRNNVQERYDINKIKKTDIKYSIKNNKIKYLPDQSYHCAYFTLKNGERQLVSNPEKEIPYVSICGFTDKFFPLYNYKKMFEFERFTFYVNTINKVILKKH